MKEVLDGSSLGPIRTISARYPLGMPADGAKVLAEKRYTNWLGNGVHPLSLLVHLGGNGRSQSPRTVRRLAARSSF